MTKLTCILVSLISLGAMAGGYEKAVMWSGKWAGLAGASAGAVEGADASMLNPAGLVDGQNQDMSVNASIVSSQFKGPGISDNKELSGDTLLSVLPAILYKKKLSDQSAIGFHAATIAGSKSMYKNAHTVSGKDADLSSNIQALEIGVSYARKLNKNYSYGIGWRITHVKASFDTIQNGVVANKAENLSTTDFTGVRLGMQYKSDSNKWGFGATYRSKVSFRLEDGDFSSKGALGNRKGKVNVANSLPQSLAFGTWYQMSEKNKLFTELTWYNYAVNERIDIEISETGSATLNGSKPIDQHWKDMYAIKLGLEHQLSETSVARFGLGLTTQVTNETAARNTFSAPGHAPSIHLGYGKSWNNSSLDIAGEYLASSGEGKSPALKGDYESSAYVLHTSYKFHF